MPATAQDFRRFALAMPQTEQKRHMNHPDFRVAGKIFATLGYPNKERGMVKLTPVQQQELVESHPTAFSPVTGAWGRQGCTSVLLAKAPNHRRRLAQSRSVGRRTGGTKAPFASTTCEVGGPHFIYFPKSLVFVLVWQSVFAGCSASIV